MKCTLQIFKHGGWHRRRQDFGKDYCLWNIYLSSTCCIRDSHVMQHVLYNGEIFFCRICLIWDEDVFTRSCDSRCEKTFECQTRDLSIALSTSDLISLCAEGVASFIRLHNCRPACLCLWHMVVKSAALLLSSPPLNNSIFFFFSHIFLQAKQANKTY